VLIANYNTWVANLDLEVEVFKSGQAVGRFMANLIEQGLNKARSEKRNFVLGCPSGRTPRSTLIALKQTVRENQVDLSNLVVVMMDDYVTKLPTGQYENVSIDYHFSCRKWATWELRDALNSTLPATRQIKSENVRCPDGSAPAQYELWIDQLGGIDLFLLASGASDGHVAFNGPGEPRSSLTRIVTLAETTRIDNLGTFPEFREISEVPRYGVSVGIATIADKSKSAVMLLLGPAKRQAFSIISRAKVYDTAWPASIIAECSNALVIADQAAAS